MNISLAYIGDMSGSNYPLALYLIRAFALADPDLMSRVKFSLHIFPYDCDLQQAAEEILAGSPEIVALSCYVWNIESSLKLCDHLKNHSRDLPIVLGGPEVSPTAKDVLELCPSADIVVVGEGEDTFRELLLLLTRAGVSTSPLDTAALEGMRNIPGLLFRLGDTIHETPRRQLINELGMLPDIFDDKMSGTVEGHRAVLYETFRGCPYACSFCEWSESDSKGRLRFVPMERIQKNIRLILETKVRELFFIDSALNAHPERAKDILRAIEQALLETGSNTMIGLHLSVEKIDDEICELLARTGIHSLVGLQTFGETALVEANRRWFKRKQFEQGIKRLKDHGAKIYNIQIIYGLPDDNHAQFQDNVTWCLDQKLRIWSGPLLLLPGTVYSSRASELEIVADPEPPYQTSSSRGYSAQDMVRSKHLATGIDFYNRLGPGVIEEAADTLNLSRVNFLEEIGSWWNECNKNSEDKIP